MAKGDVSVLKTERYLLHIKSSDGIVPVDVEYQFDEDNDLAKVKLVMAENIIEVFGDCTESVFGKLAKVLPDGYEIHSCYTCRFGNFCPYGNQDNEIFCINDFEPKSKEDILFIFQDSAEVEKRCHTLFDVCDEHKPCSNNYWTYK